MGKHSHYVRELGGIDFCSGDFGFCVENTAADGLLLSKNPQEEHQRQLFSNLGMVDDLYLDTVSPPFQSCHEEITKLPGIKNSEDPLLVESEKENPCAIPFASLGILKEYRSGFRLLNGENVRGPSPDIACTEPKVGGRNLSTEDILRLAGEMFIQSFSQMVDDHSTLIHPFAGSFLGLSDDETSGVELVQNLLASAEKVGQQQYDRARKHLSQCECSSSDTGNPVQRLVYYFSQALQEKIDRETGQAASKDMGKKQLLGLLDDSRMSPNPAIIAFHLEVPFCQVCQFTGIQAIIECVAEAKKFHLIDLEIKNGIQCAVLMQGLASRSERPIELLRITAIGTKSKAAMEKTGERLMSFAQSMNLPFSFNVVMVSDMLDLSEDLFNLEDEEAVAVYALFSLRTMIPKPDRLEHLMRELRKINPRVMVLVEVEANHNSPVFVNRFIEALFFYGALFDCLGDCMDPNDPNRKHSESMFYTEGIQNIVMAEGEERIIRHVNISVWRTFFARFGLMEEELSTSSLYQAGLVVKNFSCGSSCSFSMDGKCLVIGWKGTPLYSVSAWKFIREGLNEG